MIRSIRSKALKRYAETGDRAKLSIQNLRRLDAILERLETAVVAEDMNIPGWRFHALKGKLAGRYAVDASGNWRVTFGWDGADAVDVDLEDYH
ncbi:MAG: plasmid maintenance system killer protein [Alphaproteobacteria bacterium]|nr:MAG: plasmid maintenance system killer protein [Alphaproteobacteria bacterium]